MANSAPQIVQFFTSETAIQGVMVPRTYALDKDGKVYLANFRGMPGATSPSNWGLLNKPELILQPVLVD